MRSRWCSLGRLATSCAPASRAGEPRPRKAGRSPSSPEKSLAGRARTTASPATTTATPPAPSTHARSRRPCRPEDSSGRHDRLADRPDRWDRNGGDGPFSDKRLARVQFAAPWPPRIGPGVSPIAGVLRRPPIGSAAIRRRTDPGPSRARTSRARRPPTAGSWRPSWPARSWRPADPADFEPRSSEPTAGSCGHEVEHRHRRRGRCSWPRPPTSPRAATLRGRSARSPAEGPVGRRGLGSVRRPRRPSRSTPALALLGLARRPEFVRCPRRMCSAAGRSSSPSSRPTGAGSRRPGLAAPRATPSGSRPPAGPRWPCWRLARGAHRRRRLDPERQREVASDFTRRGDRSDEVDLERPADAVTRQVFELGADRADSRPAVQAALGVNRQTRLAAFDGDVARHDALPASRTAIKRPSRAWSSGSGNSISSGSRGPGRGGLNRPGPAGRATSRRAGPARNVLRNSRDSGLPVGVGPVAIDRPGCTTCPLQGPARPPRAASARA